MEEERKVLLKSILDNIVANRNTYASIKDFAEKNGVDIHNLRDLYVSDGFFDLAESVDAKVVDMGEFRTERDDETFIYHGYFFKYEGLRISGSVLVGKE